MNPIWYFLRSCAVGALIFAPISPHRVYSITPIRFLRSCSVFNFKFPFIVSLALYGVHEKARGSSIATLPLHMKKHKQVLFFFLFCFLFFLILGCTHGQYSVNQIKFYIQWNIIGVLNSMGVIKVSEPQTVWNRACWSYFLGRISHSRSVCGTATRELALNPILKETNILFSHCLCTMQSQPWRAHFG